MDALHDCAAAAEMLKDSQIASAQKAGAAHTELLNEIRKGHAELVQEFRQNKADIIQAQDECQIKTVDEVQQSRAKIEEVMKRDKLEIEARVLESQVKIEEEVEQSQVAIVNAQRHNQIKTENGLNANSIELQNLITAVKDLAIRTSNSSSSSPLPPAQPIMKGSPLMLSISLDSDDNDLIENYIRYRKPISIKLENAHPISNIITRINQAYGRPAQTTASSQSKLFTLTHISIPDELGEADTSSIFDSNTWTAWCNSVLMHASNQIKVHAVFTLTGLYNQSSKKRKLDGDGQARSVVHADFGQGRNYFSADGF